MPPDSPLAEASPRALEELFNADPYQLSRSEREAIVGELRRMRTAYMSAEAAGKRAPRSTKIAAPKLAPSVAAQLSLDDLDI